MNALWDGLANGALIAVYAVATLLAFGLTLAGMFLLVAGIALAEPWLQRLSLPRRAKPEPAPEPLSYEPPRPWTPATRERPRTEPLPPEIIAALTGRAPHEGTARERIRRAA